MLYFHQGPRREDDEGEPAHDFVPTADPSPERQASGREIRERLRDAIDRLSPRQRSIFVMKHFEEMSIPEIADLTGLDSGTIKSHLFRAAHKIRERLSDLRN